MKNMTRWQHFTHMFDCHDWHDMPYKGPQKVTRTREKCGPFDPGPLKYEVSTVTKICCQCGQKDTRTIWEWNGL